MAFKMKGPSMHRGTSEHRSALKEIGNKLDLMNRGKKASPAKLDDTDETKEPITDKERERRKEEFKKDKEKAIKERKEADKKLNEKRKKDKQIVKDEKKAKKRADKLDKIRTTEDKPGTVVSRTAKKIWSGKDTDGDGKGDGGIKNLPKKTAKWAKEKWKKGKENRAERKKARQAEWDTDGVEGLSAKEKLAKRREKRSRIADNLEYIFLDGKRPEEAKHRRANDYYKEDEKLKKKDPIQTDDKDVNDKTETTYSTLTSDAGDPYVYRHDPATDTYQYKGPKDADFKSHEKGSSGDNAIRKRYAKK